jgi:hypothetical protein
MGYGREHVSATKKAPRRCWHRTTVPHDVRTTTGPRGGTRTTYLEQCGRCKLIRRVTEVVGDWAEPGELTYLIREGS